MSTHHHITKAVEAIVQELVRAADVVITAVDECDDGCAFCPIAALGRLVQAPPLGAGRVPTPAQPPPTAPYPEPSSAA